MSMGIRLSSLTFLILSIILLIYNVLSNPLIEYLKEIRNFIFSIKIPFLCLISVVIFANLKICLFNLEYFSNPFYKVSPPEFLDSFFPNPIYTFDYRMVKESLSLRNIPLLIKPLVTIVYSSFGIEPIRFLLNKFKDINNFIFGISGFFLILLVLKQ